MLDFFLRAIGESLRSAGFEVEYGYNRLKVNGVNFYASRRRRSGTVTYNGELFRVAPRSRQFDVARAVQTTLEVLGRMAVAKKKQDLQERMRAELAPFNTVETKAKVAVVGTKYVLTFETSDLGLALVARDWLEETIPDAQVQDLQEECAG